MTCICCSLATGNGSPDDVFIMGLVFALQHNSRAIADQFCEVHKALLYQTHLATRDNVPVHAIRK
jgi:hypothetical protein